MKKKTNLLLIAFIMFATLLTAQNSKDEFQDILKNIPFEVEKDLVAKAHFKVNDLNKIIEVKVICEDSQIANFIKTRLLHTKLKSINTEFDKVYALPIKIKSKKI